MKSSKIKQWKTKEYLVQELCKDNLSCTLRLELPSNIEQTRHYENWVTCLLNLGYKIKITEESKS
jgi:hypothetical protein